MIEEKNKNKISIIVPVYNTGKYIDSCMKSLLNQSYNNIEIILVNDGSTDDSGRRCDYYAKESDKVVVSHKKNEGLQSARTAGIELASGEYIGFVDSDDWIEPEMYEAMMCSMRNVDLVTSGIIKHLDSERNVELWYDSFKPGRYEMEDPYIIENLFFSKEYDGKSGMAGGLLNNLVCKLFKTEIIKKIYKEADVGVGYAEDLLFLSFYLMKVKSIAVMDKCFYHYRFNEYSMTNTYNSSYFSDKGKLYNSFLDACASHKYRETFMEQFQKRFMYEMNFSTIGQLKIDSILGFPTYRFPHEHIIVNRSVILFGAGKVGTDYYYSFNVMPYTNVVSWVDNKKCGKAIFGRTIQQIDVISDLKFDYIICAVLSERIAHEMIEQCINLGVDGGKILWYRPRDWLLDYYKGI